MLWLSFSTDYGQAVDLNEALRAIKTTLGNKTKENVTNCAVVGAYLLRGKQDAVF